MDKRDKAADLVDEIDIALAKEGESVEPDIKSAKQRLVESTLKELMDDADVKSEISKTREVVRRYMTALAAGFEKKSTEIIESVRGIKLVPKDEVRVSNLKDIPQSVFKFPKFIRVERPAWISELKSKVDLEGIKSKLEQITNAVKGFKLPTDPENPVAVRLSDGKEFINQLEKWVTTGSGGGSVPTVQTSTDGIRGVPIVNPDGSNITLEAGDISGVAAYSDSGGTDKKGLVDSDRHVQVDVLTAPTTAVTQSGTWDEVGINDSGNSITVDATDLDVRDLSSASDSVSVLQATASNLNAQVVGDIASGATDSGNPVKVGGKYNNTLPTFTDGQRGDVQIDSRGRIMTIAGLTTTTATSADGLSNSSVRVLASEALSQANMFVFPRVFNGGTWDRMYGDATNGVDADVTRVIPGTSATHLGKAEDGGHTTGDTGVFALGVRNNTPNTATTGADADYSQVSTDMVGGVRTALYETDFAVLGTNHVKKYYTSAGAATDGIVWSPAAGKRWYVTDIFINVSAAATVTLEDDKAGGDEAIWKAELAANSGWSHHFGTPLFSGEDAADLIITTSAGNVYVTVTGYEI